MADDNELTLEAPGKLRPRRKQLTHAEQVEQMLRSPSVSMRLLGAWCTRYENTTNSVKRWAFPYSLHARTRDLAIFKRMAESWAEADIVAVMDEFFATSDPRVMRSNYSVTDFQFHAPRLRQSQQTGGDVSDKTASNIHEISKAMGRKA